MIFMNFMVWFPMTSNSPTMCEMSLHVLWMVVSLMSLNLFMGKHLFADLLKSMVNGLGLSRITGFYFLRVLKKGRTLLNCAVNARFRLFFFKTLVGLWWDRNTKRVALP